MGRAWRTLEAPDNFVAGRAQYWSANYHPGHILDGLHELGVNILPVLASAGVIGLAFSLGSQTVIKDYLGGILILTENQFTVGDVLTIGNLTGTVERITLRATYLRDTDANCT